MSRPARPGFLLDTCTALIALTDSEALSAPARKAILAGPNFLSAATFWEVVLKSMKGRLDVGDPRAWWPAALEHLSATPLFLRPEHIAAVCALPPIHKDPFDRILLAQAVSESLTLVTCDGQMTRYASRDLRVER